MVIHRFETRSFPNSLAAFPCDFSFYVADPLSSIRRLFFFNLCKSGRGKSADKAKS
jgi:hypothetical protein